MRDKVSIIDNNHKIDEISTRINIHKDNTSKAFDQIRGEMNAKLSGKADVERVQNILDVSISRADLSNIDSQINTLRERIGQIEIDLKSDSNSDKESEEQEDMDMDGNYENDFEQHEEYEDSHRQQFHNDYSDQFSGGEKSKGTITSKFYDFNF